METAEKTHKTVLGDDTSSEGQSRGLLLGRLDGGVGLLGDGGDEGREDSGEGVHVESWEWSGRKVSRGRSGVEVR